MSDLTMTASREHDEQVELVRVLRAGGVPLAASLNGVRLTPGQARRARAAGMTAGEPDLRIDGHPLRPDMALLRAAAALLREAACVAALASLPASGAGGEMLAVAEWLEAGAPSAVYVELKAPGVAKRKRLEDPEAGATDAQRERMAAIRAVSGATCIVAYGAADALARLRGLGR